MKNWKDYREMPVEKLALQFAGQDGAAYLLRQVEGWQKLRDKVPTWAGTEGLEYPPRLSLEQCSGEEAAKYKAEVAKRLFEEDDNPHALADLTGGLGVDFSLLAPLFGHSTYVERQEELCRLAMHNFPLLGVKNAEIVCGDGVEYLKTMKPVDLIFLDPARRDGTGRKTVRLADCQPDAAVLCPLLLEKTRFVMLKLSPMLDINEAVRELGECVREVHVVSRGGECKDLLIVLERNRQATKPIEIVACEGDISLRFTEKEENEATPTYTNTCAAYLYEPGAAVLKAGAFRTIATRFCFEKLHPNTHLYTSDCLVEHFPGRTFRLKQTFSFSKADVRRLRELTGGRANLTVRNFPASVAALRKKLKLAEGGNFYIFATTLADEKHSLLLCEKISVISFNNSEVKKLEKLRS